VAEEQAADGGQDASLVAGSATPPPNTSARSPSPSSTSPPAPSAATSSRAGRLPCRWKSRSSPPHARPSPRR